MRTMRRGLGVVVLAVLAISAVGVGHAGASGSVHGFGPADLWVGLKNSDDQGTSFDIKLELFHGGPTVATIIARCVTGVTRNPALAKEVTGFSTASFSGLPTGTYGVKISTRIGTNSDDTKCGTGHNNATGLRLYYDATSRSSNFTYRFNGIPIRAWLHSDGNACVNAPSTNVTTRFFNLAAPATATVKCKDSGGVNFAGGNNWSEIGTWTGILTGIS